jgi:Ser/Thr protein kinase RdoA (MazF antagonist)
MSISSPHGNTELAGEADWLCSLIEKNALSLRAGGLGSRFRLENACFRLHAEARNTIYRVTRRFEWFLKLPRSGDLRPMTHERLGAHTISAALGNFPLYCGAAVTRVSTDPAYVLATAIPGKPLNRALLSESWRPGTGAVLGLELSFRTLGALLAALHVKAPVGPDTPAASTRPFERLGHLLGRMKVCDATTTAIAEWHDTHRHSDEGVTFLHGNVRLDNVLRVDSRLGFIDFENCGTGSLYQDLSRPVSELLLTRCLVAFPHRRTTRCLGALAEGYAGTHPYVPSRLWDYVAVRLARYYLETRSRPWFSVRVGGFPVVRSRLDGLLLSVLRNKVEEVAPELAP